MEVNLFCLTLNLKRYIIFNTEYLYIGNKNQKFLPLNLNLKSR